MRVTRLQNAINGVSSPGTANVRIVDVMAVHGLILDFGGTITLAQIPEIRVYAQSTSSEREIFRASATDLDSMSQFFEYPAFGTDLMLYVPFAGPGLLEQVHEDATAIQIGVPYADGSIITSLRVEVDIAAGATAPTLAVSTVARDAQAGMVPTIPYVRRTNIDVGSSGFKNFPDLVNIRSAREGWVTQVFIKSAQLTQLQVSRNSVDVFDRTKAVNERIQRLGVRTPVSGFFVFDTRENGYGTAEDALAAGSADTLIWKLNMAAAESNIAAYVWSIGPLV